jgi:hypothetical protein
VLLSLQLEKQKKKARATFPFYFAGESKAEISCFFPFSWRAKSRDLVLLSLQLENWKQKYLLSLELGTRSRNLVLLFLHLENQK